MAYISGEITPLENCLFFSFYHQNPQRGLKEKHVSIEYLYLGGYWLEANSHWKYVLDYMPYEFLHYAGGDWESWKAREVLDIPVDVAKQVSPATVYSHHEYPMGTKDVFHNVAGKYLRILTFNGNVYYQWWEK